MKFFTRELYQLIQESVPEYESDTRHLDAREIWDQACVASGTHYHKIKARLSTDAQALAETSFHDGFVTGIEYVGETLKIVLDTRGGVCEPIGEVTITFSGVKYVDGLETVQQSCWLYFETGLHPEAAFEYRVLLHEGEFSVAADRVEIIHIPQRR